MCIDETILNRSTQNKGKKFTTELQGECIVCTSHDPNKDGYIRLYAGKGASPRMQMLHRMIWESVNGRIPERYEIDHICRNRKCCNIKHLQALINKDHKVKTNKERYAERIEGVIFAIQEGVPIERICEAFNVTKEYVNRYKRHLRINT